MPEPIRFSTPTGEFEVKISYRKIRGRGPGAPERTFGSDGIFQIAVVDAFVGTSWRKGLPFQSKMNWRGKNKALLAQAKTMEAVTPGGIVIDFSARGYKSCTAKAVVAAGGSRASVDRYGAVRPLGQILSKDFLDCTIGARDLFYEPDGEWYFLGNSPVIEPQHVITTTINVARERTA